MTRIRTFYETILFELIRFSPLPSDAAMTIDRILGKAYPFINFLSFKDLPYKNQL
jgi:hypothetical protein